MKTPSKTITYSLIAASLFVSTASAGASDTLSSSTYSGTPASSSTTPVSIPTDVMASISRGTEELQRALLSGAAAQEQLKALTAATNGLKKQNLALKFKTAVLKAKHVAHQKEKKSFWQGVRSWFAKIDGTKVVTTILSGALTILGTLLLILL